MPSTQKPLKIGFVFDDSLDSNDGVAQYVKSLGGWMSQQGHEVRYLVGQSSISEWQGGKVYSLAKNLRVIFNGNRLSMPLPASSKKIKDVLGSESFDVLHIQMPYSPFMAQKIINQANPNTVIFGTFHILPSGWLASAGSRLLRILYGRSTRKFDRIFSVSPPAAEFARRAYKLTSSVLPNVVNIRKFAASSSELKSSIMTEKSIVFLGRLVKRKGVENLIMAYLLAKPDANLIIAGDGPLRPKLERLVRKNKATSKVKFLGFIDEADKPGLLKSASIACFPSLYGESFGIVLIEAMAAGAGVILAGNNPGYVSVLGAQPQTLVDPSDIKGFANRLNELLNNHNLIDKLHKWQLDEVKKYDVDIVGQQLLGEYRKQIAKVDNKRHN